MWFEVEAPASLSPDTASFASGTAATGIAAPARSFRRLMRLDISKLYIRYCMSPAPLSETSEDYLKEIHRLESEHGRATTSALAASLGVSPPSVTSMLKKLATLKLVAHEPYRGAKLTPAGRKAAVEVIRHHRLLEQYLAETLGMPIDEVHAEADGPARSLRGAGGEDRDARLSDARPHGDRSRRDLSIGVTSYDAARSTRRRSTIRRIPDDRAPLGYLGGLRAQRPSSNSSPVPAAEPIVVSTGGADMRSRSSWPRSECVALSGGEPCSVGPGFDRGRWERRETALRDRPVTVSYSCSCARAGLSVLHMGAAAQGSSTGASR
jgi:DtxR family Mn-dependent transcriptional regulator